MRKHPLQSKTLWTTLLTAAAAGAATYLEASPQTITMVATLGLAAATLFARFSGDTSNAAVLESLAEALEEMLGEEKAEDTEAPKEDPEAPRL